MQKREGYAAEPAGYEAGRLNRFSERHREAGVLKAGRLPRRVRFCGCGVELGPRRHKFCEVCAAVSIEERDRLAREDAAIKRLGDLAAAGLSVVNACVVCGEEFRVELRPEGAKTCSYSCSRANEVIRNREARRLRYHRKKAVRAGAVGKACSECGREHFRRSLRCYECAVRRDRDRKRLNYEPVPATIARECVMCGRGFMTNRSFQVNCGDECRELWVRRQKHDQRSRHRKRDRVLLRAVKEIINGGVDDDDGNGNRAPGDLRGPAGS